MTDTAAAIVNQVEVDRVRAYVDRVSAAPELADREVRVVARWVGESRAKISVGDVTMFLGGFGEPTPMQAVLGCLAACDIDLVAMHASLLGIEISELWVEVGGRFHVARYLGLDSDQPPGLQHVDYIVHLRVREASEEQVDRLQELCVTGSPVADTLNRPISTRFRLNVHLDLPPAQ